MLTPKEFLAAKKELTGHIGDKLALVASKKSVLAKIARLCEVLGDDNESVQTLHAQEELKKADSCVEQLKVIHSEAKSVKLEKWADLKSSATKALEAMESQVTELEGIREALEDAEKDIKSKNNQARACPRRLCSALALCCFCAFGTRVVLRSSLNISRVGYLHFSSSCVSCESLRVANSGPHPLPWEEDRHEHDSARLAFRVGQGCREDGRDLQRPAAHELRRVRERRGNAHRAGHLQPAC